MSREAKGNASGYGGRLLHCNRFLGRSEYILAHRTFRVKPFCSDDCRAQPLSR
jgi:hypothetical protein